MVRWPRTPARRHLLLLCIVVSSFTGLCLAIATRSRPHRPHALRNTYLRERSAVSYTTAKTLRKGSSSSSSINNSTFPFSSDVSKSSSSSSSSFHGQCPREFVGGYLPLLDLRMMIDRAMVLRPSLKSPSSDQTCLPAPSRCQAGDLCAKGGLCSSPDLPEDRLRWARRLYLEHCPHLTLFSVMSRQDRENLRDTTKCCDLGRHLLERNQLVYRILLQQESLLTRSNYGDRCDIGQGLFNVDMCASTPQGGCVTCQEAYRRWVCAQLFVFHDGEGCPVQPCSSICHCVEQKCPYFLPQGKPVAGEPSFLCEDPSVGVVGNEGTSGSPADPSRCYEPCPHNASLGPLHEKTNSSDFALCIHEDRNGCSCHSSSGRRAGSPQCLSSTGTTECVCNSAGGNSISVLTLFKLTEWTHYAHLWTLLLSILRTRVIQLPRGFT